MRQHALRGQRRALAHPEAVLLVDDRERERRKLELVLEQRVRAHDEQRLARGEARLQRPPLAGRRRPGHDGDGQPRVRDEAGDALAVLAREQLGGHEQRRLLPGLDRDTGREQRHDRLAAAHVPDDEAMHGSWPGEIGPYLRERRVLPGGERERQRGAHAGGQRAGRSERQRASLLGERAPAELHHHLHQEQLLEREPPARLLERRGGRREVEIAQRLPERQERVRGGDARGHRVRHRVGHGVERAADGEAQAARGDTARERVHGDESPGVEQRLEIALHDFEHRIEHLPLGPRDLAAHDDAPARHERAREERLAVEVARQRARAVRDRGCEIPAPAAGAKRGRVAHLAHHREELPGAEILDAHEPARVEPGARVVADQVLERDDAQPLERLRALRPDAGQELHAGARLERGRGTGWADGRHGRASR